MPADPTTMISIKALYETEEFSLGKLLTAFSFRDGIWWRDRIYVRKSMQKMILHDVHDSPMAGHWGILRTTDLLYQPFGWPKSRAEVLLYIKQCRSCQSIKVDNRPPQGKMVLLTIPDRPWFVMGVDFIVKLPL